MRISSLRVRATPDGNILRFAIFLAIAGLIALPIRKAEANTEFDTWDGGSGTWDVGTNWSSGNAPLNGNAFGIQWDVTVSSGSGQVIDSGGAEGEATPVEISTLDLTGGALNVETDFIIDNTFSWSGGALAGGAPLSTDVNSGITMDTSSNELDLNGGILINDNNQDLNQGIVSNLSGGNNAFLINDGGSFMSKTTLNDAGTDILTNGQGISTNTFENDYIFNTTGAVFIGTGVTFYNSASGSVNVQSGFLWLDANDNGSTQGNFNVSSGALLVFAGDYNLDPTTGYSLSGAGNVNFNAGTISLSGSLNLTGTTSFNGAMVTLSGPATAVSTVSVLNSGTLASAGNLSFNQVITLTGGELAASGTTFAGIYLDPAAGSTTILSGQGATTLTNPSGQNADFIGNGAFEIDGAAFDNYGIFNAETSGTIQSSSGGFFNNLGTFSRNVAGGTFVIGNGITFTNDGTVNVQVGTLDLQGGDGIPETSGTFNVSSGATLIFDANYSLLSTSALKSAGIVDFNSGTTALSGSIGLTGLTKFTGATVSFPSRAIKLSSATVSGGELDVPTGGSVTFNGAVTWTGGAISLNQGTIAANGGLTINTTGTGTPILTQGALTVGSTATFLGSGVLEMDNGAILENSGTFSAKSGNTTLFGTTGIVNTEEAAANFNNRGHLQYNAGNRRVSRSTRTSILTTPTTVNVQSGALWLLGGDGNGAAGSPTTGKFAVSCRHCAVFGRRYDLGAGSS